MMNRAGATKAQMAPFPSDSQQLWKGAEGYSRVSSHVPGALRPGQYRDTVGRSHNDIVNPYKCVCILSMTSRLPLLGRMFQVCRLARGKEGFYRSPG